MPRVCTICTHPERAAIDAALVEGEPLRDIARRVAVSKDALARHKADHVPGHVAKAHEAEAVAEADTLLDQLTSLQRKALDLLEKAERGGDYKTALAGVREARACIELLLEVEGELDRRNVTNIIVNPQWIAIRGVLITALQDHPDARLAVADALVAIDEGRTP